MIKTSQEQNIQELQYSFPYHYIPNNKGEKFSQVHSWSWGAKYLGGLSRVLKALEGIEHKSLIDIGCGDGRFLGELNQVNPQLDKLGIDYSERAIAFAKAFNPGLNFECLDLTFHKFEKKFDVATMVEVLEHIPVDQVDQFLEGIAKSLKPNGALVLTVPHKNKPVSSKHFQHFSSEGLREVLSRHFSIDKIEPFDRERRWLRLLLKLMGFHGNNYLITNRFINNFLYKWILKDCLKTQREEHCCRLLAIARVKA